MRSIYRCVLVSILLSACGSAIAATPPAMGLGQSWPNAADVSANPHYHVYTFERSGVRYVQVNDGAGTVRGAVGLVGDEVLDLPVGVDANHWATVVDGAAPVTGVQVYRDDAVSINVAIQPDGSAQMLLVRGECDNPLTCSVKSQ